MNPRLEQINLNLLLALDALLTEQNVTRAAKRLGLGQSAMSRNLGSLRSLLKDELLVRVGNTMQPTPYALSIQGGLRRNLADLQRLLRTGGGFDPATAEGSLRIASPGHIAALFLPELVARVEQEAPKLQIRIEQLDAASIHQAIQGGADLAIGPLLDLGSAVEGKLLCRDPFACLVRADHPVITGDSVDLETYLRCAHLVISPTGRGGSLVDAHLGERTRRVVVQAQSFLLAPVVVSRTDLVLTAPRSVLMSAEQDRGVKRVAAPLELPALKLAAYWDPRRGADPRVRWLLESVQHSLGVLRDSG